MSAGVVATGGQAEPSQWMPAELVAIRDVTPTIREFTLRQARPAPCPPGAHIRVRFDRDGRSDHRSYSVVRQDGAELRIAVKRQPASRGGSAHMWSLSPGAVIDVAGPFCDFPLSFGASHHLLIAGGVGITPMLAMASRLMERGDSVRMVFGAGAADEFAYRADLAALLGSRLHLVDAAKDERIDIAGEIAALPDDAELYMCGPLGMMEAIRAEWQAAARSPARLRYETFGSSGSYAAQPFVVRVPRLGVDVPVAADQSMLDALVDAGVELVYDCRRGECGLCAVDVLAADGPIDHRDVFFSERQHREGKRLCACVSRVAGGSVTIDPAWRGDDAFMPA